ncbi:MAG: hypothetical protein KC417_13755 [Myxococcales bacterium]|nr:hypothetical protein [Myxococcales bacterium]
MGRKTLVSRASTAIFHMTMGALVLVVSPAHADPKPASSVEPKVRVAVLRFQGSRAERYRVAVEQGLADDPRLEVVPLSEVERARRSFGIEPRATPSEMVDVAEELRLDAFVAGTASKGSRIRVKTTVHRAEDGERIGGYAWTLRRHASSRVIRETAAAHLASDIARTGEGTPWYERGHLSDEQVADVMSETDEEVSSANRWRWLRLQVVGGTLHRSFGATATVLNNGREPGGPAVLKERRAYESGGLGHLEAGVEAEFYPGAIGDSQAFPWLGVLASFRHSIVLSTDSCLERTPVNAPCAGADRFELDTSTLDLSFGLRARSRLLGSGWQSLVGHVDLGWRMFAFDMAREDLLRLERYSVIPPLTYQTLFASVGVDYGVAEVLELGARAGYHLGLGIGRDAREVWGVDSSGGAGLDLGLRARVDMGQWITPGLYVALDASYFNFTSTFRGQTACVNAPCDDDATDRWEPWPSDPADPNKVTGGIRESVTDHYYRLSFAISYAL